MQKAFLYKTTWLFRFQFALKNISDCDPETSFSVIWNANSTEEKIWNISNISCKMIRKAFAVLPMGYGNIIFDIRGIFRNADIKIYEYEIKEGNCPDIKGKYFKNMKTDLY